jgi:putative ABC transport system permease protein
MGEIIYIFISFYATFACALAFGVTYNAARISLSERGRELATLRVLGLSTAEISYILLGEIAALTALSIPLGVLLGYALAWLIDESFATELYRVPMVLEPSSIGVAVVLVLAATAGSAELVRRRVRRLDLIAVLKTRE